MTADNTAFQEIVGGHRPPLQKKLLSKFQNDHYPKLGVSEHFVIKEQPNDAMIEAVQKR